MRNDQANTDGKTDSTAPLPDVIGWPTGHQLQPGDTATPEKGATCSRCGKPILGTRYRCGPGDHCEEFCEKCAERYIADDSQMPRHGSPEDAVAILRGGPHINFSWVALFVPPNKRNPDGIAEVVDRARRVLGRYIDSWEAAQRDWARWLEAGCKHRECHNPSNCPEDCKSRGLKWCPHQRCREWSELFPRGNEIIGALDRESENWTTVLGTGDAGPREMLRHRNPYKSVEEGGEALAAWYFRGILLRPEGGRVALCSRCGHYFFGNRKRRDARRYCSRKCKSASLTPPKVKRRRARERDNKVDKARRLVIKVPVRRRPSWQRWIHEQEPDLTLNFLTRIRDSGELPLPWCSGANASPGARSQ